MRRAPGLGSSILAAVLALAWMAPAQAVVHRHRVDRSGRTQVGKASFEGRANAGRITASGTPYSPRRLTAASRTLPLGTKAKVTNSANGRSVDVTVTDRGPYVRKRILDVSSRAASRLGLKRKGVATVKVQPLREPSPHSAAAAASPASTVRRPERIPGGGH